MSLSEGEDKMKSREWGYFLFEKIEVDLQLSSSAGCVLPATWEWLDVIVQESAEEQSQQLPQESAHCTVCALPIRIKDNQLNVVLEDIPVHDGHLKTESSGKQRSDILCILGMLRFCEELVIIQKMRVLLWDDQFASVVITVDVPNLSQGEVGCRAIYSGGKNRIRLHPATQALLASMRSDWKYLEMVTEGLVKLKDTLIKDNSRKARIKETLMPAKFSLEEVYQQINDSFIIIEIYKRSVGMKQQHTTGLTHLSADIWTDHISPFLDAKSLHALRQSCSQLNVTLQSVIPGLKLRLFQHQKRSLTWMRSRESRIQQESDLCHTNRARLFSVEGDDYRAASGGVATLLELRSTGEQLRIDQLSGRECDASLSRMNRTVARGGLLCDDPGLGKTITVLSLILQTAGMLPDLPTDKKTEETAGNDQLFDAYWEEQYTAFENRRSALLRLTNSFLRSKTVHASFPPVKKLQKLAEQNYKSCQEFQDDFEQSLRANYEDSVVAEGVVQRFREHLLDFKKSSIEQATRSFTSVTSRPNSAVAALVEESNRIRFFKSLLPSKATLLVVPAVLMDHWEEQIRLHVDFKFLSTKTPMIFNFGEKMKMEVDEAKRLLRTTHSALVFLDRGGTKPLPSREFLAGFQIVITTIQRFSNEWKNGSFEQDVRRSENNDVPGYMEGHEATEKTVCSLLKIYWHRMTVGYDWNSDEAQHNYRDNESMCYAPNHRCLLCWEEHNACNLMNENRRCEICGRTATDCPEEESKSHYLIEKMAALHQSVDPSNERPLKVIVFSQFRKALNVVGDRLYRRFGSACVAEYWGRFRKQELSKFIHDNECWCLLLTKDGSEGLDLSFVTHIFLLEEIWDKALEDQVVARAWRMGARGRVQVETLVAQHSVEEIMMDETRQEKPKEELTSLQDMERKKMHSLLCALRLITDYQRLGNGLKKSNASSRSNAASFDGLTTSKKRKRTGVSSLDPPSSDVTRSKRVSFQ